MFDLHLMCETHLKRLCCIRWLLYIYIYIYGEKWLHSEVGHSGMMTFAIQIYIFIIEGERYVGGARGNAPSWYGLKVFLEF